MKKFKVVIGRKNVENLDLSKLNVVPKSFSPYLIDLNPSIAYTNNLNLISGRDKEINRIYTCLLSQNKSKIVLLGDHGVGKSATVQKLMYNVVTLKSCPKELLNLHFLYFDVGLLINGLGLRSIQLKMRKIYEFLSHYTNLVLYIEDIHLVQTHFLISYYFSNLIKLRNVKIIGVTTEKEFEYYFQIDTRARAHIETIFINKPNSEELCRMIRKNVKYLEKSFKIIIDPRLVKYAINISSAFSNELSNPAVVLSILESSLITAKRKHRNKLTKTDINSNFNFNYKLFKKISKEDKKMIAYHEAGHFLVNYYSDNIRNLKTSAITIVPAEDYLGVTTFNYMIEKQLRLDRNYFIDSIACNLAGRVSESIFLGEDTAKFSNGAAQDLISATITVREVIMQYGMVDEIGKNMTYFTGDYSDLYLLSEDIKNKVNAKTDELIEQANKRAQEILNAHLNVLKRIAEELLKNEVLDEIDLKQICNQEEMLKKNNKKFNEDF